MFEAGPQKLGYHPFSTPRAILSQPYNGRPACTYCGFCQAFGCHVGAKSSILVTKLPEADATGNFKLITGAMCYRVNSDNSGRVTGVSYYGPDGSDNTIEAELVILAPFIYDNMRLLLLSKTDKFPNGLANSSGHVGKHVMAHIDGAASFAAFDDRHVNVYMGPSAQKHTIDDFNADNFDHGGLGFIRGAQISVGTGDLEGGPIGRHDDEPAARHAALGRGLSRLLRQVLHAARGHDRRRPRTCPTPTRPSILIPTCATPGACRRRASPTTGGGRTSVARVEFMQKKMEEIGRAMGAAHGVAGAARPRALRARTIEGGTRMGSDPKTRWSTATARAGTSPTCSSSAARPSRP